MLRDDIHIDPDVHGLLTHIEHGGMPHTWSLRNGLIFFDGCLYIPATSPCLYNLLARLLAHDGQLFLRQVALGIRGLPHEPPSFLARVILLQKMPHNSLDMVDVGFIDFTGYDLLHV